MSLWMLLLVILLTAASVGYLSFGANAQEAHTRRKYYSIASVLAAALVALVMFGVVKGRWKAARRDDMVDGLDGLEGADDLPVALANNDDNDFFFGQFGQFSSAGPAPAPLAKPARSLGKAKRLGAVGQVLDTAVMF